METQKDLTSEQQTALSAYIEQFGKTWKTRLLADWMNSGSTFYGEYAYLQQLRNQRGPRWLAAYPELLDESIQFPPTMTLAELKYRLDPAKRLRWIS